MDASSLPAADMTKDQSLQRSDLRALMRLGRGLSILFLATFATIVLIVLLIPEQNDYSRGTELKHNRLAQIDTRKIVLIGGSNLSFGVDSPMIQKATGCPVVNMGMNGYFGVRYMLEEVKAHINPSDIVVLSFEYDNLYKSV